jgi:hypothetical protein
MSAGEKIAILFLGSSPSNLEQLNLNQELHGIQDALDRSQYRDRFSLRIKVAARIDDLFRSILEGPQVVHFAGHGEEGEIYLEDDSGSKIAVAGSALGDLFAEAPPVDCILLNACYSKPLADELVKHVPCVIGMHSAVQDPAAIAFAGAFYDALGAGMPYEKAFRLGVTNLKLKGLLDRNKPTLVTNPAAGANRAQSQPPKESPSIPAPVPQLTRLSGPQYKALHSAMLEAYNAESLSGMAQFDLGVKLSNVAGGSDFSAVVFNFIDWAQRNGQLQKLLQVCAQSSDPDLQNTIARLGQIN